MKAHVGAQIIKQENGAVCVLTSCLGAFPLYAAHRGSPGLIFEGIWMEMLLVGLALWLSGRVRA